MITPFFTITQDDEYIFIAIKISHVRFNSANVEMIVDDNLFIFSLSPYYLRLRFPSLLVDDDERSFAKFNSQNETIDIRIPKLNKGEFFEDLDLTTTLLARSNEQQQQKEEIVPKINDNGLLKEINSRNLSNETPNLQVKTPQIANFQSNLGSTKKTTGPLFQEIDIEEKIANAGRETDIANAEGFGWEIEQKMPNLEDSQKIDAADLDPLISKKVKYGFNNQYDSMMEFSIANGNDINELSDPDHTSADDRIMERLIKENIKFDPEYYAADYIMEKYPAEDDDKRFKDLINWKNPITLIFLKFYKQKQQQQKDIITENFPPIEFTKDEQEQMLQLPKKSYLVEEKKPLYTTIISLLFSYCFDLRENEGDHNIESAWTIGKLTPQISFLDTQIISSSQQEDLLRATVITLTRRALSYPLHRNYNLILKTWDDVYYQLRSGKRYILRNLLAIRELFRFHDIYYIYCKILLDDLCSWFISDVGEGTLRSIAHDLRKIVNELQKKDITYEKVLGETKQEEDNDEDMKVLSLLDIELMAQEMYDQQVAEGNI
ncbi:hypothetical protein PACTADRAFT_47978 [Pachysolen tannophilus NRRL Y-2460]|uniref:CS domain-containing protein n=1 Tax=Pachysolen tannophilus NRRL Y-2460 TaxID=669874 RepID=A0A1E4U2F0_PACTA|nr:hypothetical protein PACTADRAFT_47978 [Pachysolen tannophilus NRRL Y-2460]